MSDNFSKKIYNLRIDRGMTLKDVAEKVGVGFSTIRKWETGMIANIKRDKILSLANALGTTPAYLMGWSDEEGLAPKNGEIPLVGRIACGTPATAEENVEDYIPVPKGLKCEFALTAKGDSMIGDRITNGDIVYIRQQAVVPNGCIAAVLVDGEEATLKHIYYEDDKIILRGSNPEFEDIVVRGDQLENVRILGRAVAITTFI